MGELPQSDPGRKPFEAEVGLTWGDMFGALRRHLILLLALPLTLGLAGLGVTYLIAPVFTATAVLMPPQQQQSSAAALASLGALGSLAAGAAGISTPEDRYVALMRSATVSDRIIDKFKLMTVFGTELRDDARKVLAGRVLFDIGKKDGLIRIHVEDTSPRRAAEMANAYVEELRSLTAWLAVTEAQQRRKYFERQLNLSRERLNQAQRAVESGGFSSGALNAEPRTVADAYAKLRAEATVAEVRLHAMREALADGSPEIRQQQAILEALQQQLAKAGQPSIVKGDADFIGRYREYKYQEALFELYARQLEVARADEAREGPLIQVVDPATPPERRTRPRRASTAVLVTLLALLCTATGIIAAEWIRRSRNSHAGSPPS